MNLSISPNPQPEYSDKQVVPCEDVVKEIVTCPRPYPDAYIYSDAHSNHNPNGGVGGATSIQGICGLSRRTFTIVVAILTALVAAAITGGSVGGVLTSKKNSHIAQASPTVR